MSKRVLFLKAHVDGYARGNVYVAPYERTPPVISFRSGASAPADFRGYVMAGHPVGVSLAEFGPGSATWDMVAGYAARGGKVFVDTGAFTSFTKGQPVDWDRTVELQQRLARDAGPRARLHFVAPDVVGDQAASLALLARYRADMRRLIDAGHDVLVPIQRGALKPYDAWRAAADILGTDRFTAAVPSNKVAFSREELAELFDGPIKPPSVHFLGVAGNKAKLAALAAVVHRRHPLAQVTSDANRIRAMTGKGRAVTEETPRLVAVLKDAFASLLDDPKLREAWNAQAERALGAVPRALAIAGAEKKPGRQSDLFGGGT